MDSPLFLDKNLVDDVYLALSEFMSTTEISNFQVSQSIHQAFLNIESKESYWKNRLAKLMEIDLEAEDSLLTGMSWKDAYKFRYPEIQFDIDVVMKFFSSELALRWISERYTVNSIVYDKIGIDANSAINANIIIMLFRKVADFDRVDIYEAGLYSALDLNSTYEGFEWLQMLFFKSALSSASGWNLIVYLIPEFQSVFQNSQHKERMFERFAIPAIQSGDLSHLILIHRLFIKPEYIEPFIEYVVALGTLEAFVYAYTKHPAEVTQNLLDDRFLINDVANPEIATFIVKHLFKKRCLELLQTPDVGEDIYEFAITTAILRDPKKIDIEFRRLMMDKEDFSKTERLFELDPSEYITPAYLNILLPDALYYLSYAKTVPKKYFKDFTILQEKVRSKLTDETEEETPEKYFPRSTSEFTPGEIATLKRELRKRS